MDAAAIQAKINYGYGKAAAHVGYAFSQYRPDGIYPIFSEQTLIGMITAAFTVARVVDFSFKKPALDKDYFWSGLFDATNVQVGDFLISSTLSTMLGSDGLYHIVGGAYYIASMKPLIPPVAVLCNAIIDIKRPDVPASTDIGAIKYQELTETAESVVILGMPASVQLASSGRNTAGKDLPGDAPGPLKWSIFFPFGSISGYPPVKEGDFVYDDFGRRFQVSGFTITPVGARIDAIRALI